MCIVCIEYEKGKLTLEEACKNIQEINISEDHKEEVLIKLINEIFEGDI